MKLFVLILFFLLSIFQAGCSLGSDLSSETFTIGFGANFQPTVSFGEAAKVNDLSPDIVIVGNFLHVTQATLSSDASCMITVFNATSLSPQKIIFSASGLTEGANQFYLKLLAKDKTICEPLAVQIQVKLGFTSLMD